jgi:hypothetical protein
LDPKTIVKNPEHRRGKILVCDTRGAKKFGEVDDGRLRSRLSDVITVLIKGVLNYVVG